MAPGDGVSERYLPQIDALRTFAFIGVVYSHSYDLSSHAGTLGVNLFFVISGFLITDILLGARRAFDDGGTGFSKRSTTVRNFYLRRIIRLWPAYFLLLFLSIVLDPSLLQYLVWFLTQTLNVKIWLSREWEPWAVSHLWTLNVEEQFYLIWPLFIMFLPLRHIRYVVAAIFIVGLIWRASIFLTPEIDYPVLVPDVMVFFAAGAGLVFLSGDSRVLKAVALVGPWALLAVAVGLTPLVRGAPRWIDIPFDIAALVGFTFLVDFARRNSTGPLGALLAAKPLVQLGRLTYGAYLFHLLPHAVLAWRNIWPEPGAMVFVLTLLGAFCLAGLSWRFMERPINRLKRFVPLDNRGSAQVVAEPVVVPSENVSGVVSRP